MVIPLIEFPPNLKTVLILLLLPCQIRVTPDLLKKSKESYSEINLALSYCFMLLPLSFYLKYLYSEINFYCSLILCSIISRIFISEIYLHIQYFLLFYLQTKLFIKLQSFPPLMGPGKNIIESISDIKYVSARLQQDKKHCIFG